jgi:hypothetical protein
MTFVELLLRFFVGYACGLLTGPLFGRYYSKPGDVSIRGGIAGALGSAGPYVLLNSIWVQQWMTEDVSVSPWLSVVAILTRHTALVSLVVCIFSIAIVEWIGRTPRAEERPESASATPDVIDPAIVWRLSVRKSQSWLWLCTPAVAYSLWERFVGRPTLDRRVLYVIGLLAFVGFVAFLVSSALSFLTTNNE